MRRMTILLGLVFCIPAGAQPNPDGFVPGHVFITTAGGHGCFDPDEDNWIFELDPETGESWGFANRDDGLCGPTGLRFTPDGKRLRVLNLESINVMDFDSMGNGTVVYDESHGLRGPRGGNGLAWDEAGDFYVANNTIGVLKFPAGGGRGESFVDRADGALAFAPDGDLFVAAGAMWHIKPDGTVTTFHDFGGQQRPSARSVEFDDAGNLYVGTVLGRDLFIYRYDGTDVNTRRVLVSGFQDVWLPMDFSADDRILYATDANRVYAVDPDDGETTVLYQTPPGQSSATGIAAYVPPDDTCRQLKKQHVKAKGQGRIVAKVRTKLTGGRAAVQCRGPFGFPRATRRIKDSGKAKVVINGLFPGKYSCAVQQLTDPDGATPCTGWFRPVEVMVK